VVQKIGARQSNPEEVQRIIRQKEQARDAEQRLDEALE